MTPGSIASSSRLLRKATNGWRFTIDCAALKLEHPKDARMDNPTPAAPAKLPRVLGFWMATAIVIGTVIGSGIFKKPHDVAKNINDFGLIMAAWVLVGVLSFIGSLILAEIAIIYPRAGGNYV